jgi:hypothetical protein
MTVFYQPFLIPPEETPWGVTPWTMVLAQSEYEAAQFLREGAKLATFEEYNRWFSEQDGMLV